MDIRAGGAVMLIAIGLAACGSSTSNSTATPSPTPAATPYVASDSGFSAVFPATPVRSTHDINQPGIALTLTLYLATANAEQVGVAYEPLPVAASGTAIQAGLDGAVAGSATNVGGTVISKAQTEFLGQPAEDAVIQGQGGAVVHERIVFIGAKVYVLEGITSSVDAKHPGYDMLLATFKTI
jgi:hypothetical protein